MRRVLILGGGAAGYAAAQTLAVALGGRAEATVGLISAHTQHVVRPLLPELVSAALPPRLAMADLARLVDFGPVAVHTERVERIDLEARQVETDRGTHPFDYLLIALGESANPPAGLANSGGLQTFRSDLDAIALRKALERARAARPDGRARVAILGGGPVGVSLAATLAEADCQVTLLERAPRLLPSFETAFGDYAAEVLGQRNVAVQLGTSAEALTGGEVRTTTGALPADVVVWAGGQRSADPVAELAVRHFGTPALPVDRFYRLEGHPRVAVAGANAGGSPYQARVLDFGEAVQSGQVAARNLLAAMTGQAPQPRSSGPSVQVVGLAPGVAVATVLGLLLKGRAAWALYRFELSRHLPRLVNRVGLMGLWSRELVAGTGLADRL